LGDGIPVKSEREEAVVLEFRAAPTTVSTSTDVAD
jgi:hypothetical protein